MNNLPAVVTLRASLYSLVDAHRRGAHTGMKESALRAQVVAVVDELRALGWPPERIVIAVKEIAVEAGLRPSPHFPNVSTSPTDQDDLLSRIVSWCITRYYNDSSY